MQGPRIRTIRRVQKLAHQKKAVTIEQYGWSGHQGYLPAAWVINYPAGLLLRLLDNGRVFEYVKKENKDGIGKGEKGSQTSNQET